MEEIQFEKGSGNIYADIGCRDADSMQRKARMVFAINEIVKRNGWTQSDAAARIAVPERELCDLLEGRFRAVSEGALLDILIALGSDVRIIVTPSADCAATARGTVSMEFADAQHALGRNGFRQVVI